MLLVLNDVNWRSSVVSGNVITTQKTISDGVVLTLKRFPSMLRGVEETDLEFAVPETLTQYNIDAVQDLCILQTRWSKQFHVLSLTLGDAHPLNQTHGVVELPVADYTLSNVCPPIICGNRVASVARQQGYRVSILVWNWKTGQLISTIVSWPYS
ncbi:hypothetical protein BC834DRAFT_341897 [Gloeopeniophorella convolvens]|nr:hypothetical protein BC834DRAFT_341897 [Gloeopeniophorella convolvens]